MGFVVLCTCTYVLPSNASPRVKQSTLIVIPGVNRILEKEFTEGSALRFAPLGPTLAGTALTKAGRAKAMRFEIFISRDLQDMRHFDDVQLHAYEYL